MKIVVLDGAVLQSDDLDWSGLERLGEVTVYDRTPPHKIVERIGSVPYVYTNKTVVTAEVLRQCREVRFIGLLSTGCNAVDLKAAKEYGVTVCNVPAYCADAVAQFTFALLLEICHNVGRHDLSVKNGDWENCADFCYWNTPQLDLAGKTMGVIGYGRIGQVTAKIAESFGMNVIYYSRRSEADGGKGVSLDFLLANADVISLHCPLTEETEDIINRATIAKMKDGVILLNTSRGPLVVEEDLAAALNCGKIYAAACDVVSSEPIRGSNPLLTAKNVILTPHIAWASKESRAKLMNIAVNNLCQYINGTPVNVVV